MKQDLVRVVLVRGLATVGVAFAVILVKGVYSAVRRAFVHTTGAGVAGDTAVRPGNSLIQHYDRERT